MTCFALGIIISVTKKEEEIAQELKEKEQRDLALQKLIDKQLEEETLSETVLEGQYSIEDKTKNPMNAVLNK
jgi:cell division protein FtsW